MFRICRPFRSHQNAGEKAENIVSYPGEFDTRWSSGLLQILLSSVKELRYDAILTANNSLCVYTHGFNDDRVPVSKPTVHEDEV